MKKALFWLCILLASSALAQHWSHVYKPQRLIIKAKKVTVTGTIVDATHGKRKDGVRHEAPVNDISDK